MEMPIDPRFINIIGQQFGFLEVIDYAGKVNNRHRWLCKCLADGCNNEKIISRCNLGKSTISCGCINDKKRIERNTKHNMSRTKIYLIWKAMIKRCECETDASYERYGERGIQVSESWHNFENFYSDMGNRPEGTSLDRIDNNGNYCKENCRWATYKEQQNNRRDNLIFNYNGELLSSHELAARFNIPKNRIYQLLHYYKSKEKVIEILEKKKATND